MLVFSFVFDILVKVNVEAKEIERQRSMLAKIENTSEIGTSWFPPLIFQALTAKIKLKIDSDDESPLPNLKSVKSPKDIESSIT